MNRPADLAALDGAIVRATQAGLPLCPRPYDAVAQSLGVSPALVVERLRAMLASRAVRRIGAVPNHYRLGWTANGMSVWDVDDARIDALGERVGALAGVTHCYRRPRRLPAWRYNLFAMLHGRDRAAVEAQVASIAAVLGDASPRARGDLQHPHPQEDRAALRVTRARRRATAMFRVTEFMREIQHPTPPVPRRSPPGPVVIWNLIRRCNLACKHCYSISADVDFAASSRRPRSTGRWTTSGVRRAGAHPVGRGAAPAPGHHRDLASREGDGLLRRPLDQRHAARRALAARGRLVGYDYVGISLDGSRRRTTASGARPARSPRRCRAAPLPRRGIKVGIRFTLTQDNAHDLPALLELMETEDVDKFYLSHLNYGGRGNVNRKADAQFSARRARRWTYCSTPRGAPSCTAAGASS
jgi:DNA-binding Lrp family transcriptional regulator